VLTFLILCVFAVAVGALTTRSIRDDFELRVSRGVDELRDRLQAPNTVRFNPVVGSWILDTRSLQAFTAADQAVVRLVQEDGSTVIYPRRNAPPFGVLPIGEPTLTLGYLMESRYVPLAGGYNVRAEYGRPLSEVDETISQVRFLLIVGVLGGAALALMAGLIVARNAMRPVARMTATTRAIAETRDPERRVPVPGAQDEVAELAATLNSMLAALESSREETEAMLARQRQFVADASHELRTPLTSVLANLELLVDELSGESGEAARSALRSSQRMRRLVADLLLLARADVRSSAPDARVSGGAPHTTVDLADVAVEVAAELEPVTAGHEIVIDASPGLVVGARDDLHRLTLNLLENAVRHTPPGTRVHAAVEGDGSRVRLTVEDDGPGIAPELRDRVFERFVRGEGDRGGSFGLGLSIVRAVATSHGGSVRVESPPGGGTRFVVELPAAAVAQPAPA
jgi:signal transduction histidine kinase